MCVSDAIRIRLQRRAAGKNGGDFIALVVGGQRAQDHTIGRAPRADHVIGGLSVGGISRDFPAVFVVPPDRGDIENRKDWIGNSPRLFRVTVACVHGFSVSALLVIALAATAIRLSGTFFSRSRAGHCIFRRRLYTGGTLYGRLAQLARACGSHPQGHRSESCIAHCAVFGGKPSDGNGEVFF